MDFRLSYHWLKEFVDIRQTPEELAELLSLHSVSVERVRRLDEGLDPTIIVGRVERIEPHPNADKLKVAYVAVRPSGSEISNLKSQIRVVCGGTNLREGMLVAYAPAGARVRWHGEGDLVELKPTEIRGVRSEGMICSAREIGLADAFPGEQEREILDLSFRSGVNGQVSGVGQRLAAVLGLDDVVLDVEVTTNRPDLMSVVGLAREVAAITGAKLRAPSRESSVVSRESDRRSSRLTPHASRLRIRIADRSACLRYGAVILDGVRVGSSPWWLRRRLLAAGLRPIANIVDVTNYIMLELGQPLHAFDADALRRTSRSAPSSQLPAPVIVVRRAKVGESLAALDGNTYALRADDLVIAARPSEAPGERGDAERPIALAGVIGGQETGVTSATTRIVLECANFSPVSIRKTMRALNVRTDAGIRFEKGLQPDAIPVVLPRAVALLTQVAGGTVGKPVVVGPTPKPVRPIAFHPARASARIGVSLPPATVRHTLTALGCTVQKRTSEVFAVTPPWWRRGDLAFAHDLVEEVVRLHGYHRLPSVLPAGTLPAAVHPPIPPRSPFDTEQRARELLADLGCQEVMAYALTSPTVVATAGFSMDQCVWIENPLSEDLALLRPSLIPTLLPIVAANQEHHPKGMVFELANVYVPQPRARSAKPRADRTIGLPREELRLLVAAYGRLMAGGHVERLKGIVERLFQGLGIRDAEFRISGDCVTPTPNFQLPIPPTCRWHPGRTMDVSMSGILAGVLGELHPAVVANAGIDARVAVAELDWAVLLGASGMVRTPMPPPQFPAAKRDIAFVVDRMTPYAEVVAVLERFDPLLVAFELFDTYEGASVPLGRKSMAFHCTYSASDRTLTAQEVDAFHAKLAAALVARFGAELRE